MKRLYSILTACTMAIMAWADGGVTLGYCNGQVSRTSNVGVSGETTAEAAILITADMLSTYAGADISSIRVGLAARTNIDKVRAWVRTTLDGENLAQGEVTTESEPAIQRGWNEIALNVPYPITAGQPLYVGFSYEQRAESKPVSVVSGSHEGAFYYRPGADATWEDRSAEGLLSVEAVVTGGNVLSYDLQLLSAEARYNNLGEIELTATVHNNASKSVDGFTLTATAVAPGQPTTDYHYAQPLANGASTTISFTFMPESPRVGRDYALWLDISSLDGGVTDEQPDNNRMKVVFSYPRTVLIEEFTGEECTNCPKAARFLHEALATGDNANRTAMMAHHSGYYPDWLTFQPSDVEYEWFYNHDVAVYAPALMLDRVAQEASYDNTDYMTPCFDPGSKELIEGALAYMIAMPSHAYIDIDGTLDDSQLNVTVKGGRSQVFGTQPARLTVCLVEDHIQQRAQKSLDTYPQFEHMGVLRAINSTWGDVVEWDADDHFSASYSFTLSDEWVPQNMRVIAFLSNYDAGDPCNCAVENTAQLSLSTMGSGISAPTLHPQEGIYDSQLYDLQGRRLPLEGICNPQPGKGRSIIINGTTRTKYIN